MLRPAIGGGLQLSSGASVLARLGIDVREVALPLRRVRSRAVDGTELLSLDVSAAMARWRLLGDMKGPDGAFAIMREGLQELLLKPLPAGTVRTGVNIVGTRQLEGGSVACTFEDGSSEEFDLVVGCDGIGSAVQRSAFPNDPPSQYSGIKLALGIAPRGTRPVCEASLLPDPSDIPHKLFKQSPATISSSPTLQKSRSSPNLPIKMSLSNPVPYGRVRCTSGGE